MKKLFAILFATMLASQAWAQNFTVDNLSYYITDANNHYVSVAKGSTEPTGALTIPSTVTNGSTTYSVTSIARDAFSNCSGLTSITIPNTVTSIGGCAFQNCGLATITIPSSVISVDGWVFNGCTAMTEINVDSDNPAFSSDNGIMYDKNKTTLLYCPGGKTQIEIPSTVTIIGSAAFWYNKMTSIIIPNSVKSIGSNAFYYCDELTSINIPSSVESIGGSVFSECKKLTEISVDSNNPYFTAEDGVVFNKDKSNLIFCLGTKAGEYIIPNTVKSIGDDAFDCCRNLTSIIIPNTVTSIGDYVFDACFALSSIIIPNSVTSIGIGAFRDSHITSITIPSSVTNIGYGAFEWVNNVVNLSSVTSSDNWGAKSYTSGSDYEFSEDGKTLIKYKGSSRYVYIPSTVTSIGDGAFQNHTEIASVYIPNSVECVGDKAFAGCNGLRSIEIPESVTSLASTAFEDCSNLTDSYIICDGIRYHILNQNEVEVASYHESYSGDVVIPETVSDFAVTGIGDYAFSRCSGLTSVTIGNSVKTIGYKAFGECSNLKSVTIGNSVEKIGNSAFYSCSKLESVIIGNSVKSIGDYAFYNCSNLSSINRPESVTHIGEKAFSYTKVPEDFLQYVINGVIYNINITSLSVTVTGLKNANITDVTFPATVNGYPVKSIAPKAFANNLNLKSVTIGDNIETIGESAFANCRRIRTITLGESVKNIEAKAFRGCHAATTIKVPDNAVIGEEAFMYVKNIVYSGANNNESWKALTVNGYVEGDFVYADSSKKVLTGYFGNEEKVEIPNCVEIGPFSFFESLGLKSVTIPSTVTRIGKSAFSNCRDLKTINIPSSVSYIGLDAFCACEEATITCDFARQPAAWDKKWNYQGGNVVWRFATAIDDESAGAVIYAQGRTIVVENATDEIIVYDAMGQLICRDATNHDRIAITVNGTGVYIVKTGNVVKRVMVN